MDKIEGERSNCYFTINKEDAGDATYHLHRKEMQSWGGDLA
jgi:hypothetical protein